MICKREVPDGSGWHWHKCGKPATWYYVNSRGEREPQCNLHANKTRRAQYPNSYEPIPDDPIEAVMLEKFSLRPDKEGAL